MISLRHVGIVVNDHDLCCSFWLEVFSAHIFKQAHESGHQIDSLLGTTDVSLLSTKLILPSGFSIELLKIYSHPGSPNWKGSALSTGLTHIALNVDSVDKVRSLISDFGIDPGPPSVMSPDNSVKVCYALGPENLILELVETCI